MALQFIPRKINLKRDEKLEVQWQDGHVCVYTISFLRSMCPCASCKAVRENGSKPVVQAQGKAFSLNVLPGNYASGPITVTDVEKVGNYALKLVFSDQHDSGIFSYQYLREICPT